VSELHYHPANPSAAEQLPDASLTDDDFEFIEIRNVTAGPLELSGAAFVEGIDYTFPQGSVIGPNATIVLVSNAVAFARRYGAGVTVYGEYAGQLDNSGERLVLLDPFGQTVLDFTYRDSWHLPVDGGGYSMVAINQTVPGNPNDPAAWAISAELNGSPGSASTGYSLTFESWLHYHFTESELVSQGLSGLQDDPDADGLVNLMEYALGTDPRSVTPESQLPKAGKTNPETGDFLTLTFSRPLGTLDLTYTPEFSFDLSGWSAASVAVGAPVASGTGRETVVFRGTVPAGLRARGFARLNAGKQ
jgi:hypothetical protein